MIAAGAVSAGQHLFWITSRSAGIAAMALASGSVTAGLLLGGRSSRRAAGRGADLRALHEALSLATLAAIAVHGAALLGDRYLHPGLIEISVPFAGGYRTFWTGLGIASGWALAALGLSYYARARIGQSRWRALHRFTALFWAAALVHSLGSGTDAGQPWFLTVVLGTALPATVLLLGRLAPAAGAGEAPRGSRASASSPQLSPARQLSRPPAAGWE